MSGAASPQSSATAIAVSNGPRATLRTFSGSCSSPTSSTTFSASSLSASAPPSQLDLKFNDFQYGVLITVFAFVYAIFALPLGFLADRIGRKMVVGVGMMIASVATLLTGTLLSLSR